MKSILKKLFATALALTLCSTAIACGGDSSGNDSSDGGSSGDGSTGTLKIGVLKKGYGTNWLTALEKEFEKKTGNTVKVDVHVGEEGQKRLDNELESRTTDYDILFSKRAWFAEDVYKGGMYADLTDVWNSVVDEGTELTIKDKMDPLYADALNIEGSYYNLPWAGGVYGIVRNLNVWEDLGLTDADMPYTTNELFALCDKVKEDKAPFIYSVQNEYYTGWSPIFFGQYEGVDNVNKFMDGRDEDGEISEYIYSYAGHLEAMKVLETLLNPKNEYQYKDSNAIDFTMMQGLFLIDEALFCVNGTWLESEMSASFSSANIDMIKTPVISALVNKLSFKTGNAAADDAKLKEVIQYVDAVDAGESPAVPANVTTDDIKIVTEARHYSYMAGGVDHRAYVPAYSNQISLAKEFLKFMYSDEGLNIYYKALKGVQLPAKAIGGYDSEGLKISGFLASANKAQADGFVYNREPKSRYLVLGKISACYENGISLVDTFRKGEKTAAQVVAANESYVGARWTKIKDLLGL